MLDYDVVVVGAGPVGGNIAGAIARERFRVAIFESNKQIGIPVNCAGLITPRVFDLIDIEKKKVIQNAVKGAHIYSPSGKVLTIGGDRKHAYVIDRSKFDKEIIEKSKKHGAEVFLSNKVISAQKNNDLIELKTSQEKDIRCKLLIGTDGPHSMIRDRFSLPEPADFLRGIGAEVSNIDIDPDFVEIFVGSDISPGFFAWIIPTNKNGTEARIGLCISQKNSRSPKYYLTKFLKHNPSAKILKDVKINEYMGGIIPLGFLKKTFTSNVLIAGDAASQVKPTSGGGIYTGLLCGKHCSSVAIESLKKNDFSESILKKYHKLWTADVGRELFLGMKFRNIYKNLSDGQLDKYVEKFQNPKIIEIITKYGDIDYPSKLVKPLLKKAPTLLKLLPNMFFE